MQHGEVKRYAPDGGGPFSRSEFVDFYGGTDEWDAAVDDDVEHDEELEHDLQDAIVEEEEEEEEVAEEEEEEEEEVEKATIVVPEAPEDAGEPGEDGEYFIA